MGSGERRRGGGEGIGMGCCERTSMMSVWEMGS